MTEIAAVLFSSFQDIKAKKKRILRGPKKGDKMCDRIKKKPDLTGGWSLVVDAGVYNIRLA